MGVCRSRGSLTGRGGEGRPHTHAVLCHTLCTGRREHLYTHGVAHRTSELLIYTTGGSVELLTILISHTEAFSPKHLLLAVTLILHATNTGVRRPGYEANLLPARNLIPLPMVMIHPTHSVTGWGPQNSFPTNFSGC